ncbi:GspE/PulE family protein [Maridesulfovibrio hydrothermalis]|uniref:General secretory pathway component, cryptic n=1 Tax=Maridesulfovibrio hydrothermalis AM13 = DSM 14728 TaxID=1121451 RepID=L0RAF6_9BACT|nr:GspE/PulE family protein [Maridesulfovibrio hydrothermalis]CCO23197.1 general secretory pathway component, cryptic [Maridesulfovibrio hydrothermalis AM13 = DSM 14728]
MSKSYDLNLVPREVVDMFLTFPQRSEFIPVEVGEKEIKILLQNESSLPMADFLAWKIGKKVKTEVVDEEFFFPLLEQALTVWEEESALESDSDEEDSEDGQDLLGWSHDDAPIVRLVNKTLHQAISTGASDVHFEGQGNGFVVRYRQDGVLKAVKRLDKGLHPTVIARIKVMGEMDVAESRKPQDGRIFLKLGQKEVDVRVSTIPTMNGEKAVLRILDRSKNILNLEDLGLKGQDLALFRKVLAQPHGIVLVTGPTGSGKTTSLYAGLSELPRDDKNIVTVEDPVEYQLSGINQVQVNKAAGMTFATTIRSFLRQDPDIILVGEIRDQETASTAVQASLTGHLVLSTLHTNDAATAVTRMLDMGIEPFLLASSLSLVLGQRLVRVNCRHCSREVEVSENTYKLFDDREDLPARQTVGAGCEHCNFTGFSGRRGVYELIPVTEDMRGLIMDAVSSDTIKAYAKKMGRETMVDHGIRLVQEGVTTLEEVVRVTKL